MADAVTFTPIGIVRTPFATHEGMPIQTVAAQGVQGRVELDPAYAAGLADLDGFTHLHLITYLHRTGHASLRVTPYLDTSERGIFATRSPKRPNPIGLSLVRLVRIEGDVLHVEELDPAQPRRHPLLPHPAARHHALRAPVRRPRGGALRLVRAARRERPHRQGRQAPRGARRGLIGTTGRSLC